MIDDMLSALGAANRLLVDAFGCECCLIIGPQDADGVVEVSFFTAGVPDHDPTLPVKRWRGNGWKEALEVALHELLTLQVSGSTVTAIVLRLLDGWVPSHHYPGMGNTVATVGGLKMDLATMIAWTLLDAAPVVIAAHKQAAKPIKLGK